MPRWVLQAVMKNLTIWIESEHNPVFLDRYLDYYLTLSRQARACRGHSKSRAPCKREPGFLVAENAVLSEFAPYPWRTGRRPKRRRAGLSR